MSEATQVVAVQERAEAPTLHDYPRLLVEWSSPWQEFRTALRPALTRSPARLAGEARTGLFPYVGILASWAVEIALVVAAIVVPARLASMRPYTPLPKPKYDIIYFSGEELPRTEDVGGSQTGRSGRAGGRQAFHRTQTIKVARGNSLAEKVVDAPNLNLPKSELPVANLLAVPALPGPPPASGLKSSLPVLPRSQVVPPPPETTEIVSQKVPSFRTPIVAPPVEVSRKKLAEVSTGSITVVAPPPAVTRETMPSTLRASGPIIPPAPSVPTDIAGARVSNAPVAAVVPPPVSAPANPNSIASRLSLPQPTAVEPPPGHVTRENTTLSGIPLTDVQRQVVPPPVDMGSTETGQPGQLPGRVLAGSLAGAENVVAPPVQVDGQLGERTAVDGKIGSAAVVPPPPSISGGGSITGRGRGGSGAGFGGALDKGSVLAPPQGGGGTGNKGGVVISSQPGARFGVPGNGGSGSIAMSPSGSGKTGVGGSGSGGSIGRGSGPGSGLAGEGAGAGKTGPGKGAEIAAREGISPYPGPGGAGSGVSGAAPGVSVRGGNTITLPSFGDPGGMADVPNRSAVGSGRRGPGITVEATPRSGGAFNFYGAQKGDMVYAIYIETSVGTVVLQYSDPTSAKRRYSHDLSAPQPLRVKLPDGLGRHRLVIACVLDRSGDLKNLRILEPATADMNARVLAALPNWKFQPAERAHEPVDVNAILGFNIDTRDTR
jgi:hypothetical protein